MRIPSEEQETVICIGRNCDTASISTTDITAITRLDKFVKKNPDEWKCISVEKLGDDVVGKFYECPANLVSFRSKSSTRILTEEERKAASERMKKYRAHQ